MFPSRVCPLAVKSVRTRHTGQWVSDGRLPLFAGALWNAFPQLPTDNPAGHTQSVALVPVRINSCGTHFSSVYW